MVPSGFQAQSVYSDNIKSYKNIGIRPNFIADLPLALNRNQNNSNNKKLSENQQETHPNSAVQSSQSTIKNFNSSSQTGTVVRHGLQEESMRLFTFMNSSQRDQPYFIDQAGNLNQILKNDIETSKLIDKHPQSIIQLIQASRRKRQKFLNQISLDLDFQLDKNLIDQQKQMNFHSRRVSKSTKNSNNYKKKQNINEPSYSTIEQKQDKKLFTRGCSLTPKTFKANQKRLFRAKSTLSNLRNVKIQPFKQIVGPCTAYNSSRTPKSNSKRASMFLKERNESNSNNIKKQQKQKASLKVNSNLKLNLKQRSTKTAGLQDKHKKIESNCSNNMKNLLKKKKQLQRQLLEINQNIFFKKKIKKRDNQNVNIEQAYKKINTNTPRNGSGSFIKKKSKF